MMAKKKDQSQQGKQEVLDQGGVGFTNDEAGGTSMSGGGAGEANRQSAGSGSVQRPGGDPSHQSGFLHSPPEANVFPPGKPQADNSTRSGGGHSAAGTPDEGRLGGSGGTSAAGTAGNDPDR
jgi:hypothetical protein